VCKISKSDKYKKLLPALAWLIIIAIISIVSVKFSAEIIETKELGYINVYLKNLSTHFVTGLVCFAVMFLLFSLNLFYLHKNLKIIWGDSPVLKSRKTALFLSALFAFVLSLIYSKEIYPLFLQFYSSVPFGRVDPILGQDISYYMFQRPFLNKVSDAVQTVLLFQIIYTFIIYAIAYLKTDFLSVKDLFKENKTVNHLLTSIIIYFFSIAISFKFSLEDIFFGEFGSLTGAGFTDVMVWLNYYKILPILLLTVIIIAIICLKKNKAKTSVFVLAAVPVFAIATFLTSLVVEVWFVKPYEVSMQQMYISHNIEATKHGFNLDNIQESEFVADTALSMDDIMQNSATIDNIRITDLNQNHIATNALQSHMSYFTFNDSDIIPRDINGTKHALTVSVREIDQSRLEESSQSYISRKLRYTHGYGVVASRVNKTTEEGQPDYIIKDIPIESAESVPTVYQPRIYFGEKTNDYVITGTKYSEIDYMEDDKNVDYYYSGSAGIPLTLGNRIIFSIDKLDPMILMSGYITDNSKLLTNRNILSRVRKTAPFLTYDSDPYIIFSHSGELKWVIDIYTTSSLYPYSQKYNGINYIRNSGKVLLDAYTGEMTFYITDSSDPIINVISRMYPGLFSYDAFPEYAQSQMRYPEFIFNLQSDVYKKYHVTEPETLYSGSDIWACAKEKYSEDETTDVNPYYNLMNLNGYDDLVLMQPFTPRGKENLVAWIAASSSKDSYGKMTVYKFPKGQNIYGTLHIENKIDNDPNISRELSLWNQGDSKVLKGSLMVIPIKNSLLYIEPVYVTSKNSAALPEIKRIIVAYGEKVAMEPTLREALSVLFGMKEPTVSQKQPEEVTDDMLINEIITKYNELEKHGSDANYKSFGDSLDELGKTIKELEKRRTQVQSDETKTSSN